METESALLGCVCVCVCVCVCARARGGGVGGASREAASGCCAMCQHQTVSTRVW
jgi:hypothetical protein